MQKYAELVGGIVSTGKPANMLQAGMTSSPQACQMGNVPLSHPQIQSRAPGSHSPNLIQSGLSPQLEQGIVTSKPRIEIMPSGLQPGNYQSCQLETRAFRI